MQTYTYYLTLEVNAMNEDSAENKLEGFLKGLDLKKNQHLNLTSLEMDDGEGEPDMSDDAPEDEAPADEAPKKERPPIRLPKGKGSAKWEDDFEDADWDELEEEENPKVSLKTSLTPTTRRTGGGRRRLGRRNDDDDEDDIDALEGFVMYTVDDPWGEKSSRRKKAHLFGSMPPCVGLQGYRTLLCPRLAHQRLRHWLSFLGNLCFVLPLASRRLFQGCFRCCGVAFCPRMCCVVHGGPLPDV